MMIFFLVGCTDSNQTVDSVNDDQSNHQTEETTSNEKTKDEDKANEESTSSPATNETETDDNKNIDLNEMKVHYIDAGQADATLFQYRDEDRSYNILYDAGDWNRHDVIDYLAKMDIPYIDLIIISHPHADHIGQLATIMNDYDVGEVWMSGNESSSQTFQQALEAILDSDASYEEPRPGNSASFGPLTLDVLHPETVTGKENEESLSILFTYGNSKFLFTGDAYKADEKEMMKRMPDLHADILQLGHHGSNTSSDESFIKTVDPDVAIYSAGAQNSYGHPSPEVINLLDKLNITVYGTDVHGTIIVTSDGQDYSIDTTQEGTIHTHDDSKNESKKKQEKDTPSSSHSEKEATGDCVDINTANETELQKIIHIGPARAEDVVNNRPYQSVDDLQSIKGIGPSRMADIKDEDIACTGG